MITHFSTLKHLDLLSPSDIPASSALVQKMLVQALIVNQRATATIKFSAVLFVASGSILIHGFCYLIIS
jgi:hypothetical protein